MIKRLDKEEFLGLIIVIGAAILILGWVIVFAVLPILGIGEAIKFILNISYDEGLIIVGNMGTIGGIVIATSIIYESLFLKLEKKTSRKKIRNYKTTFWVIVSFIIPISIALVLLQSNIIMFLSQSVIYLFEIEIVLFAICLMLFTINYSNAKIKNESRG